MIYFIAFGFIILLVLTFLFIATYISEKNIDEFDYIDINKIKEPKIIIKKRKKQNLTKKEEELLNIIINYIRKNKISPTIKELSELTNCKSPSSAQLKLKRLKEKKYIDYIPNTKRSIKVLYKGEN